MDLAVLTLTRSACETRSFWASRWFVSTKTSCATAMSSSLSCWLYIERGIGEDGEWVRRTATPNGSGWWLRRGRHWGVWARRLTQSRAACSARA